MKRPLSSKDYERIVYEAVADKYEPESEQRKLYMAMTMHAWDGVRHAGWPTGQKEVVFRKHMLNSVYRLECGVASNYQPFEIAMIDQPKTYRISINDKGGIAATCFDLENIDAELEGYYDSVSDLPTWVQERIAVLSVCHPEPPTPVVEGVGRRISEKVFWVYK